MSVTQTTLPAVPERLLSRFENHLARIHEAGDPNVSRALLDARIASSVQYVWTCSEFAASACSRDADVLPWLAQAGRLQETATTEWLREDLAASADEARTDDDLMRALRKFRRRHMVRIAWRDLAGWAPLGETLVDLSNLADVCVHYAHDRAYRALADRYGEPRSAVSKEAQPLVILGMGKWGGRELNYSSDIDAVFLYPEEGETDGAHPIDNSEFFLRLGQRIIHLLANKTADGFVFRVDMRLRPFGDSGRLAVSFDSFEQYLQQHGRDWERYAYVKARPITGVQHHQSLYEEVLRPFVYRRYLDFSVFESLRNMKEMIAKEVERRDLQSNIKLGPGGIREIEFMVQAFQLVRGGSDRRLQSRELQHVLPLLVGDKLLSAQAVKDLGERYVFLRKLENRLQEWNDESTHSLPEQAEAREILALAMQMKDVETLDRSIEACRALVSRHFNEVMFGPTAKARGRDAVFDNLLDVASGTGDRQRILRALHFEQPDVIVEQLDQLKASAYYRRLDPNGQRRVQDLLPRALQLIPGYAQQDVVFSRVVRVLERIGGRTVYLSLLIENSSALERLIDLCARSQFLADQIAAFPLLLDELIDTRAFEQLPDRAQFQQDLAARLRMTHFDDPELQVETLLEFQRVQRFRIAVADLTGRLPLMKVSDRLTDLAEIIVAQALAWAWAQVSKKYGEPRCGMTTDTLRPAGVVVVAYGKLGGIELGYSSDLDLVFLHDSQDEIQQTDGVSSIDNTTFFARLGQRLVHLLTVHSRAGRLYEVDIRLRPSGKGGLLVQSMQHFEEYQRKEAWTWEHQALLRARAVAGADLLCQQFEAQRLELLRTAVRRDTLRDEVRKMRERMRNELSKAKAGEFDLKQDAGGVADIEFLVQYWVLHWVERYPEVAYFSDNIRQLESLASGALVPQSDVDFLTSTYRLYRERMHHRALDGADDLISADDFVAERKRVTEIWNAVMNGGH